MACCGGRGRGGAGRGGGNPGARVNLPADLGETVILEYQGSKQGTMQRRGPITKKWYTFSASPVNRRFHCARADAEYLMRAGDLAVAQQPAPAPAPAPPAPPPVQARPIPAPLPQVQRVEQPTAKKPVPLDEEAPADDLSEVGGVTKDTAGILTLVGVRTFGDLASLTEDGIVRVSQLTGKGEGHVRNWVEEAKGRLGIGDSGPTGGDTDDMDAGLPDDVQLADGED